MAPFSRTLRLSKTERLMTIPPNPRTARLLLRLGAYGRRILASACTLATKAPANNRFLLKIWAGNGASQRLASGNQGLPKRPTAEPCRRALVRVHIVQPRTKGSGTKLWGKEEEDVQEHHQQTAKRPRGQEAAKCPEWTQRPTPVARHLHIQVASRTLASSPRAPFATFSKPPPPKSHWGAYGQSLCVGKCTVSIVAAFGETSIG